MIARLIDGLVMLVCAFLIGWHLVPAAPRTAPAPKPAPVAVAPDPAPIAECPEVRETRPAAPPPRRSPAADPSGLPAVYLEIIGVPAR